MLSMITDQLAQALDSARLLQETQRQAVREQQINDIAVRVSNALDVETMLRSVVDELGRLPGVLEASAHIEVPQRSPQDVGERQ
jgi:GAF domain-containing protein